MYLINIDQFLFYLLFLMFSKQLFLTNYMNIFKLTIYYTIASMDLGKKEHSTEHAALEIIDKIVHEMDIGNTPTAIFRNYRDLSNLDHDILLFKLDTYGIKDRQLQWFNSYLKNHTQYVEYNGIKSGLSHISTGVPQGCIL